MVERRALTRRGSSPIGCQLCSPVASSYPLTSNPQESTPEGDTGEGYKGWRRSCGNTLGGEIVIRITPSVSPRFMRISPPRAAQTGEPHQRGRVPPSARLIAETINLLIFISRRPDGARRIEEMVRVEGCAPDGGYRLKEIREGPD